MEALVVARIDLAFAVVSEKVVICAWAKGGGKKRETARGKWTKSAVTKQYRQLGSALFLRHVLECWVLFGRRNAPCRHLAEADCGW